MTILDGLAAAALLGTDRRPPEQPAASGSLADALQTLPWQADPAAAVLRAAALASVHARAGVTATAMTARGAAAPAPADTAAVVPLAAATLLRRILEDADVAGVLGEWLGRAAARGELAPPILLPTLLDHGHLHRAVRPAILAVGGARLPWLAAQRDDWAWATPLPAPTDRTVGDAAAVATGASSWVVGSRDARHRQLATLRATDPNAARDLVESTWSEDPPELRAAFLHLLRDGLSAADEPLLERALADRRKEVREAAADLLASLPGSGFRERMGARLRPLVEASGRLRKRLTVELPPLPDAAARRDGLLGRPRDGLGARAVTLSEIVAGAGLDRWTGELTDASTPEAVMARARGTDQERALHAGWRAAALRERHPAWSVAIALKDLDARLLAGLPPEVVTVAVERLLSSGSGHVVEALLPDLPGPWSPALSTAAIRWVSRAELPPDRPTLRHLAASLHPSTHDDALRRFTRLADRSPGPAGTLLHVLDLHQAILRELPTP